jgi:hypothetical protein
MTEDTVVGMDGQPLPPALEEQFDHWVTLCKAQDLIEELRTLARNNPDVLPYLSGADPHGFQSGILHAVWKMQRSLAFIERQATSAIDRQRRARSSWVRRTPPSSMAEYRGDGV